MHEWAQAKRSVRDILPELFTGRDSDRRFFGCAHCNASHYILAMLAFLYQYDFTEPPTARITQVDPAFEQLWTRRDARYEEILTLLPALLGPAAAEVQRSWMKKRYWRWQRNIEGDVVLPPPDISNAGKPCLRNVLPKPRLSS